MIGTTIRVSSVELMRPPTTAWAIGARCAPPPPTATWLWTCGYPSWLRPDRKTEYVEADCTGNQKTTCKQGGPYVPSFHPQIQRGPQRLSPFAAWRDGLRLRRACQGSGRTAPAAYCRAVSDGNRAHRLAGIVISWIGNTSADRTLSRFSNPEGRSRHFVLLEPWQVGNHLLHVVASHPVGGQHHFEIVPARKERRECDAFIPNV